MRDDFEKRYRRTRAGILAAMALIVVSALAFLGVVGWYALHYFGGEG